MLPDHKVEFVIAETYGNESYSIQRTVELTRRNISTYIGPQETCIHEARIASVFNLPIISYVSLLRVEHTYRETISMLRIGNLKIYKQRRYIAKLNCVQRIE